MTADVKISVLIATRNRPSDFSRALNSVLSQTYQNIEVIVVNDGSEADALTQYHEIERNAGEKVKFIYLPKRPNGHGPSFARNTAAFEADGDFLAFLDDDDLWTDLHHLERFVQTYTVADKIDLYFTNQVAVYPDGTKAAGPLWLETLNYSWLEQTVITKSAVVATTEWLLTASGFAHLNCTIVVRNLFLALGGFDESIRYEEDKDLYWRIIDNAESIAFDKNYVALHFIPQNRISASNELDLLKKRELQMFISEKNMLLAKNNMLKVTCKESISGTCKHLSIFFDEKKSYNISFYYAFKALAAKFSFKWAAFTFLMFFKSIRRN